MYRFSSPKKVLNRNLSKTPFSHEQAKSFFKLRKAILKNGS